MERLHVHLKAEDLAQFARSIEFHTILFGEPTRVEPDYVKWEPEGRGFIVAISLGKGKVVDHLGLKGDETEIAPKIEKLKAAGFLGKDQKAAACCYSIGDKTWFDGPSQMPYELYWGTGTIEVFGEDKRPELLSGNECCAVPTPASAEVGEVQALPDSLAAFARKRAESKVK